MCTFFFSFFFNSLLKDTGNSWHSDHDVALTFIILYWFLLTRKAISRRCKVLILFITIYVFPYLVLFIKEILFFHFQKWIRHSYNFAPQSHLYMTTQEDIILQILPEWTGRWVWLLQLEDEQVVWCQVCANENVLYVLTPRGEQIQQQNIALFGMSAES